MPLTRPRSTHLIVLLGEGLSELRDATEHYQGINWTATGECRRGDIALFYVGRPSMAIAAVGIVDADKPQRKKGRFSWTRARRQTFTEYDPVWSLDTLVPLAIAARSGAAATWFRGKPYRSSRRIPSAPARILMSEVLRRNPALAAKLRRFNVDVRAPRIESSRSRRFEEGALKQLLAELRERNPALRREAILERGYACEACGFDFAKVYGAHGDGYIEVHHLRPLSTARGVRHASVEDVVVLCANCHRIAHWRVARPLPLKSLRKTLKVKVGSLLAKRR